MSAAESIAEFFGKGSIPQPAERMPIKFIALAGFNPLGRLGGVIDWRAGARATPRRIQRGTSALPFIFDEEGGQKEVIYVSHVYRSLNTLIASIPGSACASRAGNGASPPRTFAFIFHDPLAAQPLRAARKIYVSHVYHASRNWSMKPARLGTEDDPLGDRVPGAGKTLVDLNLATRRREVDQPTHIVFPSGNGPLIAGLRESAQAR